MNWSKDIIIKEIQKINKKEFPLTDGFARKNFHNLYVSAKSKRYFGSWGKAVSCAGFDYENIKNQNLYIGLDNNLYDSLEECRLGNYFHIAKENEVICNYEIHVKIPELAKCSCDFVVDGKWIEWDGLRDNRDNPYDKDHMKIFYYKKENYDYIIFSSLDEVFEFYDFEVEKEKLEQIRGCSYEKYNQILLDDLLRVSKIINKTPTIAEYEKYGNFSPSTFKNRFGKNGWKKAILKIGLIPIKKGSQCKGSKHHRALFSEDDVLKIRKMYISYMKLSTRSLAKYFNIPKSTATNIIQGKNWKHVGLVEECKKVALIKGKQLR